MVLYKLHGTLHEGFVIGLHLRFGRFLCLFAGFCVLPGIEQREIGLMGLSLLMLDMADIPEDVDDAPDEG